jgi:tetratricopeptide (TPR) repeat protein
MRRFGFMVVLTVSLLLAPLVGEAQHPLAIFWWLIKVAPEPPTTGTDDLRWRQYRQFVAVGLNAMDKRSQRGSQRDSETQRWESAAEQAFAAAVGEARLADSTSEYLAWSLGLLGSVYYLQGRLNEAERLYKEALPIYENTFGTEHPNVVAVLYGLGRLHLSQGRFQDAESVLKRSLAILEKVGPESPEMRIALYTYAEVLRQTGRTAEARELDPIECQRRAKDDIQTLSFAVVRYEAHVHALPETLEQLTKPATNQEGKLEGPFLLQLPSPPRGYRVYGYERFNGSTAKFRIFTVGYGETLEDRR